MKRKSKRKVRSDKGTPKIAPESKSSGIEVETGIILPAEPFSYPDLPFSIRAQVEQIIRWRKRFGLPDDSKERKERAIKYFRGRDLANA